MSNHARQFDLFRNSLYSAAARSLEQAHPQYAVTFREELKKTSNLHQALEAVKGIPTDPGFSKWRPLLSALFDTELAIFQVRSALNLLETIPAKETLSSLSITEGAWVYYHMSVWTFWMHALLERTNKLVKQSVRALVKPANPQWKSIENDLLKPVDSLGEHIGKLRHPLAHGGGAAEAPAKEHLWEGFVLMPVALNVSDVLQPIAQFRVRWHKALYKSSILQLATIYKVVKELHRKIDWNTA